MTACVPRWNVATSTPIREEASRLEEGNSPHLVFSRDGKIGAGLDAGGLVLSDTIYRKRLVDDRFPLIDANGASFDFSPDGKTVAAGYASAGKSGVVLWDVGTL